jgi:O-antigen/teichoic acid export membrane protein
MLNYARACHAIILQARSTRWAPGVEAGSASGWSRLARGSVAALGVYGAGAAISYCAQLAVARTIGAHGYGIYAYVLAWVTVLAYVAALGFDVSLLRFVSAYLATRAFASLRGVVQYAWRRVAAVGCGIALSGVAVILVRSRGLSPELVDTFLVGFAVVPILALLWVRAAAVRGFGGVISALAPDRVVRDGVLLGLVLLGGAGMGWRIDARWAMAATLLGSMVGLGLVSFATRRLRPDAMDAVAAVYDALTWRRTALPLVVIAVSEALMNRTGVVLLGWLADTREAGIYALAFNIAFAVMLPRMAVNALLAPAISDLFVRDDRAALRSIVARSGLWTLLGAACIALPLLVFAKPVLALFGRDFVAGAAALRILLIGQVITAAAGSQLQLMTMTGRERSAAVQLVSSAAVNVVIGAALVGPFGPAGAALAATTALIGWNAAMGLSSWRHLQLFPGLLANWPNKARYLAQQDAAE